MQLTLAADFRHCCFSSSFQPKSSRKKQTTTTKHTSWKFVKKSIQLIFPSFDTRESHLFCFFIPLLLSIFFPHFYLQKKRNKKQESFISFSLSTPSIPSCSSLPLTSSQYKDVSLLFFIKKKKEKEHKNLTSFFFFSPFYFSQPRCENDRRQHSSVFLSFSLILYDRSHVIIHVLSVYPSPLSLPYWKINK